MKILQINKFWFRHGGADVYAIELTRALRKIGHDVETFGMKHEKNIKMFENEFFVNKLNITRGDFEKFGKWSQKAKNAFKIVYSREAVKKLDALLKKEKPDIAHIHNIYHHLSPSVLSVLRKNNVPVVQTLHDYKRLCPNHAMFVNGKICEKCKPRKYANCVKNKCVFNSYKASLVTAFEMRAQSLFRLYDDYVDLFISPSEFMKNKNVDWGKRPDNIIVEPYFVEFQKYAKSGNRVLFIGRLSEEKGIDVLLDCARALREIEFDVVGDGPLFSQTKKIIQENNLKNVFLRGCAEKRKISEMIKKSAFLLIPSKWYENYPISLLEAFSHGRCAVGTNIGGIPEIIRENQTGFLFEFGNTKECIQKVRKLWYDKDLRETFGKQAREQVRKINSLKKHLSSIIKIYKKAISMKRI